MRASGALARSGQLEGAAETRLRGEKSQGRGGCWPHSPWGGACIWPAGWRPLHTNPAVSQVRRRIRKCHVSKEIISIFSPGKEKAERQAHCLGRALGDGPAYGPQGGARLFLQPLCGRPDMTASPSLSSTQPRTNGFHSLSREEGACLDSSAVTPFGPCFRALDSAAAPPQSPLAPCPGFWALPPGMGKSQRGVDLDPGGCLLEPRPHPTSPTTLPLLWSSPLRRQDRKPQDTENEIMHSPSLGSLSAITFLPLYLPQPHERQ